MQVLKYFFAHDSPDNIFGPIRNHGIAAIFALIHFKTFRDDCFQDHSKQRFRDGSFRTHGGDLFSRAVCLV
jgi:hypothetical protein